MVKLANTLVLGASASACGFDSHYPHHVGASFASLAPIFCKNQSALKPMLLPSAKSWQRQPGVSTHFCACLLK